MPTFDFFNIIRQIVRTAVATFANPVVICLAFAASFTAALTAYVKYFTDLSLPELNLPTISFSSYDDGWLQFFAFVLDYSTFRGIVNFVLGVATTFIPVAITFIVALFAAFWIYKVAKTIRASLKDFGS